ncbi:hypothetical protein KCU66_g8804, partial [Aureobasidium melanogenum]
EGNDAPVEQHIDPQPSPILESLKNTDSAPFQQPQQPERSTNNSSQGWFSWLK